MNRRWFIIIMNTRPMIVTLAIQSTTVSNILHRFTESVNTVQANITGRANTIVKAINRMVKARRTSSRPLHKMGIMLGHIRATTKLLISQPLRISRIVRGIITRTNISQSQNEVAELTFWTLYIKPLFLYFEFITNCNICNT